MPQWTFSGKITLDKPLDVLGALESDYDDSYKVQVYLAVQLTIRERQRVLFRHNWENVQQKLNSSGDYKKIGYVDVREMLIFPWRWTKNLKITTDASYGIWLFDGLGKCRWLCVSGWHWKSPLSKSISQWILQKSWKSRGTPAFDLTNVDLKSNTGKNRLI